MTTALWASVTVRFLSGCADETVDEGIRARLEALDQSFFFPPSALAVQLSTARVGLAHCPEERALLQAAGQGRADSCCRTRYQVFKNLRGRGFYLTSAGKFGGDFLIYPGEKKHLRYLLFVPFAPLVVSSASSAPIG